MTKAAALHEFWNTFLPAYEENSVPGGPDKPGFPYMTYQLITDSFNGEPVEASVTLWYKSESNKALNAKVEEISAVLVDGGKTIGCDSGVIWLKKSSPFSIPVQDSTDNTVKGRQLNVQIEYWTEI